jgi:hypothetical protein
MSKEIWYIAHKKFIKENGREPSDKEAQKAYANLMGILIDQARIFDMNWREKWTEAFIRGFEEKNGKEPTDEEIAEAEIADLQQAADRKDELDDSEGGGN